MGKKFRKNQAPTRPPRRDSPGETDAPQTGEEPRRPPARGSKGNERLYGITPVEAALESRKRKIRVVYLKEGQLSPRLQELAEEAHDQAIRVEQASNTTLEKLAGNPTHQGVVADCGPLPTLPERDALALAESGQPLLIALDEIQDPQNLGAIIRSCAVFGADGVVLPRHHGAPTGPATSKASAGWLERFPIYDAPNLSRFLDGARKAGFWIAGTAQEGDTPLPTFRRDRPLVLVLGNEGKGLRQLVRSKCDFTLAIPTSGKGGLNVSAATAVLMYQLTLPNS